MKGGAYDLIAVAVSLLLKRRLKRVQLTLYFIL